MHYFSINANCKICNANLNLFSFKSRYLFKDGWLCKKCYKKLNIQNYNPKQTITNITTEKNDKKKEEIIFNIAGITFNNDDGINRQDILKKIINTGIQNEYLIPYNGLSIKDMKQELYDQLYEVDGQELTDVRFQETIINNKKAIMVLLNDYNDDYLEIGHVPKDKIQIVKETLDNKKYNIKCYIRGGKYKEITYYEEDYQDKEEVIEDELIYGLEIRIIIN